MIAPTKPEVRAELARRELSRRRFDLFVSFIKPDYEMTWFHRVICDRLQRFASGEIKRLMVYMPPQHGKSELSTRSLPPYLFGLNPDRKIAVLSYSASKARRFNREIQQRISSPQFNKLFPNVRLATAADEAVARTTEQFDIVGRQGSLKSVGRQGPLTGDPVDVAILDDLLKDRLEAQSPVIRDNIWNWIVDVVETRFHNDSQIIYVTTRWDEDDPAGRFLARDGYYSTTNPTGWDVLEFPALKTSALRDYDQRIEGAALWPERHSQDRLESIRDKNRLTFNSLYQQDPQPSTEARIFPDWIEVDTFPDYITPFYATDFGYSNDPTTIIRMGVDGVNLYVDERLYETGLTNPDLMERAILCGITQYDEWYADSAEPKSIEEISRGIRKLDGVLLPGMNMIGVTKGPGSIIAGINKLKEYTVHYTKSSLNLKRELRYYQWIMAGGITTNTPVDKYNHALDAIRSTIFTKFDKPERSAPRVHSVPVKKRRLDY